MKGPTGFIYVKPEDEFYHKFSTEWFTLPSTQPKSHDDDLDAFRLILLISHASAKQAQYAKQQSLPAIHFWLDRTALDAIVGNPARAM